MIRITAIGLALAVLAFGDSSGQLNESIAFVSDRDAGPAQYDVFTMNSDGSAQVNLTNTAGTSEEEPVFLGDRVLFVADLVELMIMDADGANPVPFLGGSSFGSEPSPSRDAQTVSFVDLTDSIDFDLFTVSADGSGRMNLTRSPGTDEAGPAWSPDGTQIAYVAFDEEFSADVYIMSADGSNPTNLTNTPDVDEIEPAWSPDGSLIAFASDRDSDDYFYDVFVMSPAGTDVVNLTETPQVDEYEPAWSPDGHRLAIVVVEDENGDIYTMAADGSDLVNLTNSPGADDRQPYWGPASMASLIRAASWGALKRGIGR